MTERGLFVTARHVIAESPAGSVRGDLEQAVLIKETPPGEPPVVCQYPQLVFEDVTTDIAVLAVDFGRNTDKAWLQGQSGFPFIPVSGRALQDAEPVYAFGYPLSTAELQQAAQGMLVGVHTLYPRVTSAIVASTLEAAGAFRSAADPVSYVLDKALNYGNSGGPIVAVETGNAHAVCTRFQPVVIHQEHLRDASGNPMAIMIPSLYGVVSALGNRAVLGFLESEGVTLADD